MNRHWLAFSLFAILPASTAYADTPAPQSAAAETLFVEAKRLMQAGSFALACTKFRESNRLEPGIGVRLHLASCYEKNGQLASAWVAFREAADAARRAHDPRATDADERATAIEPRMSRLAIDVGDNARIAGIRVTRNGAELPEVLWGTEVPVDGGEHVIEARAPDRVVWRAAVQVASEAERKRVFVPALARETARVSTSEAPANVAPVSGAPAWIALAAGGALAGGGLAAHLWSESASTTYADNQICEYDSVPRSVRCASVRSDVLTGRVLAGIGYGLGAVGIGVSLYLFVRKAPRDERAQAVRVECAPMVGGIGAQCGGRF